MAMSERVEQMLNDPDLIWVAIQQAAEEHHEAELTEIAVRLYGRLGEAPAEIGRLRACLHRPAPLRLGGSS
jgi:hypothetical protein